MKTVNEMERAIIRKLVEDALRDGYAVKHNDGEEYTIKVESLNGNNVSTLVDAIMQEIHSTDEEYLVLYKGQSRIGSVSLVYGNSGWDVIADHTDTVEMRELLKGAEALAESLYDER